MKPIHLPSLFFLLFISGCMVGPNYRPPEICIEDEWTSDDSVMKEPPIEKWWELFEDPLLDKYISLALTNNYDLQAAEANILRGRALRQIAAAKLFPHINLDVNGTKTYFSKNGPIFTIGQASGDPTDTSSSTTNLPFSLQTPQIQNLFNSLFDAVWELDFFGKTRRTIEAAVAEQESMVEQKNDLLLSILAEVARNYIELRSSQERSRLMESNIALFEKQKEIIQARLEMGYANQIDLETIEAQLNSAKGSLPNVYAESYRAIYTLSTLIGHPPETLVEELLPQKPLPTSPVQIAVGLRSDLLRRRPDIRYAERKLAEATAEIGVAVASFFPTISLLSTGGLQSLMLPQLFEWGSKTWAYGADVNMPIFQGGRLIGNLQLSRAEQAMAAANYQQAVLTALQDAESHLKNYESQAAAATQYNEMVLHNQQVVTITRERHLKGLIDLMSLIANEQQLISTQLTQLESKTMELFSVISLYKALGGGWEGVKKEE